MSKVYADGVQHKHKDGPQECTLEIIDDVLQVKRARGATLDTSSIVLDSRVYDDEASVSVKSSASSAPRSQQSHSGAVTQKREVLLAKLNLTTLFHRTDPLQLVRLNSNSVVIHRKSEAGRDGLLLLFENSQLLDLFVESVENFTRDRRREQLDKPGARTASSASHTPSIQANQSPSSVPKKTSPSSSSAAQRKNGRAATTSSSPPQGKGGRGLSQSRPKWDSTPAGVMCTPQTPHATVLFTSPSPVAPTSTARRGVRFDSETPIASQDARNTIHRGDHHDEASITAPRGDELVESTFANRLSDAPKPTEASSFVAHGASTGVYRAPLSSFGGARTESERLPSTSYLSVASNATGFSRCSSHLDAYLDRSNRIQHYMDALNASSMERERLLEDLFEERDRKRRSSMRHLEYYAADEDIKSRVQDHFKQNKPESLLSPKRSIFSTTVITPEGNRREASGWRTMRPAPPAPLQEPQLSPEQAHLIFKLKRMLAEVPPVEDDSASVSTTTEDVDVNERFEHSDQHASLVDEIKKLLAQTDFEALKYDDSSASPQPHHNVHRDVSSASHPTVIPYDAPADATGLQAAAEAEARLLSTLRYGNIPLPRTAAPAPAAETAQRPGATTPMGPSDTPIRRGEASPVAAASPPMPVPSSSPTAAHVGSSRTPIPVKLSLESPPSSSSIDMSAPTPLVNHSISSPPSAAASPSLWREVADAASGKTYYVHKTTKKTTWKRSETDLDATPSEETQRTDAASPTKAAPVATMPTLTPGPGWVSKQDPGTGKTFYFNKETKKTTWKLSETIQAGETSAGAIPRPSAESSSPSAAPTSTAVAASPLGWVEKKDPTTGKTFYSNAKLKKTTWNKGDTDLPSAENDTTTSKESKAETKNEAAPPAATRDAPSAAGWVVKQDAATGKSYFSNPKLKKTTWKIEETDLGGDPRSPTEQALPSNWKAVSDKGTGKTYYVNTETKKTQWTRPTV